MMEFWLIWFIIGLLVTFIAEAIEMTERTEPNVIYVGSIEDSNFLIGVLLVLIAALIWPLTVAYFVFLD